MRTQAVHLSYRQRTDARLPGDHFDSSVLSAPIYICKIACCTCTMSCIICVHLQYIPVYIHLSNNRNSIK